MRYALDTIKSLVATTKESSRVLGELIRAAAKASEQSTSTLAGTGGGLIGIAVAYCMTFVAPVFLPVFAPICAGIGIVSAILWTRGATRFSFDRKLEQNRLAAEEILGRIKALPRNAPQSARDELWLTYNSLNSMRVITGISQKPLPLNTLQSAASIPEEPLKLVPHSKIKDSDM